MNGWLARNVRRSVRVAGVVLALGVCAACGGGSTANAHAEMPKELTGFDVFVEPGVALSGEGAAKHGDFGPQLVSSIESQLVGEGFDVVPANAAARVVHVQLRANVAVSRNSFIKVNGKPLETTSANVGVKVLAPDGALLVAFDVEGDPDSATATQVAAQLTERMKGSPRLVAIAKSQPPSAAPATAGGSEPTAVAAGAVPVKKAFAGGSQKSGWPDVSRKLGGQGDGSGDAAVIVAIEKYQELTPIRGAAENGEAWFRYLLDTRGVPRSNVQMLVNDAARDQQITKAVALAATQAKKGGKLWFVFIGHGAPSSDQQGLLVGYDAYQTAEGLADRSVKTNELLKSLNRIEATPVVVLDACFSGKSNRGDALVAGLQPSAVVKTTVPASALVMTAAQSNQFAGALPGDERPAFSYLLLGALRGWADRDGSGTVTAKEAELYVGDTLRVMLAGKRQQTPTLEGARSDFVLASGHEKEPRAILDSALGERGQE